MVRRVLPLSGLAPVLAGGGVGLAAGGAASGSDAGLPEHAASATATARKGSVRRISDSSLDLPVS